MTDDQETFPITVEAAVRLLLSLIPESEQSRLATMAQDEMISLHLGLGQWVRNHLGLWGANSVLLSATGQANADDASGVIIHAFWQRLQYDLPKVH